MVSGKINPAQITAGLKSGLFHRFFHKPWDPILLQIQLRECILMSQILKESKTDSLTMTLNRRGFDEQLEMEVERALRHQRELSLILWDVDHFKQINDRDGHSVGDQVLKNFTAHLHEKIRNIDYVARLGGDEFAVILPDTGKDRAFYVAGRIHSSLKGEYCVSGGVSALHLPNDTRELLMSRADQALYASKRRGRNQVQVQD
jgi:diguanylate cyclase (GGDEF)-like protein